MPRFPAYTEEQVAQIHAFIRSRARAELARQQQASAKN
jgi:hypothetical protein